MKFKDIKHKLEILADLNLNIDVPKVNIHERLQSSTQDPEVPPASDSSIDQLPMEIKLYLLGFLVAKDLCRVNQVSKHWQGLSSMNALWGALLIKNFGGSCFGMYSNKKGQYEEAYTRYKTIRKLLLGSQTQNQFDTIHCLPTIFNHLRAPATDLININYSDQPLHRSDAPIYERWHENWHNDNSDIENQQDDENNEQALVKNTL